MTLLDWRDLTPEDVLPLLNAERRRYVEKLHWDLAPALRLVEAARVRGEVPGLALRDDDGTIAGWAFFVLAGRQLQIGALHATTAGGVRTLLDGIFGSPEAELAQSLTCFLSPTSPSVASALTRMRFELQRHHYLEARLADMTGLLEPATGNVALRSLEVSNAAPAVRLLARAYAGDPAARCFAPGARLEEWAQYLGQTISTPSLGRWLPEASFLAGGDAPSGVVITTEIAKGVAHIAQVAVDPAARRQGVGRHLVLSAARVAAAAEAKRLTLIVADANANARALYASLGFLPRGEFIFGHRGPVPRRVAGVTMRATAAVA